MFLDGISKGNRSIGAYEQVDRWKELDTTEYDFPSEVWLIRPSWEVALKVAGILPIFLVGTLANAGLVRVIMRSKPLQTTTNLLIVNMAIADLGACLACPWMFLCIDLYQNYVMGAVGCRLDGLLLHALTLVAVFSLSAVSYDRVSAVALNCSGKLTTRATRILLYSSWIFGLAMATPLALFRNYHERQWRNFLETYCTEDSVLVYPYWHIFAGLSVWAPLAIMAACYSVILVKLGKYESRALRSSKHPIVVRYKGRVTRVLALIVLAFIVCRVPFTALIIQRAQLIEQRKSGRAEAIYLLWYISRYLVLVNAAINPLLYGCGSSNLRKELAQCSATAWLFCKRRQSASAAAAAAAAAAAGATTATERRCCSSVPRVKPERFQCLKPRSPCARMHHEQRDVVATIARKSAQQIHTSLHI